MEKTAATHVPGVDAALHALLGRAKTGLLIAADAGCEARFNFWRGQLSALQHVLQGGGQALAEKDARLGGGAYQAPACLQSAWAALPVGAENLPLAQVQQLLRAQGVNLAADDVAQPQLD